MDEKSIDRTSAELAGWPDPLARLHEALQKNEFALYCQPILALTGEMRGQSRYPLAEVLVRMREEERALLPPGEFLPVFEHYGMMPQLDRWVLRHTVQQLARGSRIPRFTINVSGQTLRDAEFPQFAAAELCAAGLAMDATYYYTACGTGERKPSDERDKKAERSTHGYPTLKFVLGWTNYLSIMVLLLQIHSFSRFFTLSRLRREGCEACGAGARPPPTGAGRPP